MKYRMHLKRFLIVYFTLYILPFPLDYLPFDLGDSFLKGINSFWELLVPIFSTNLFGFEGEVVHRINGSGDALFFYFLIPTMVLLASFVSLVWHGLARKWKVLNKDIFKFFTVYLRYYLAFTMFTYGFAKVFYLQFHELNLSQLTQEFGNSSPMGLLWKFMGYSEPYSVFTGLVEVFVGFLLLFQRTKVLGACICFGVLVQVFILNMTFDVPVKLYSFHLILITLVVLSAHLGKLIDFFVRAEQVQPIKPLVYTSNPINKQLLKGFKYLSIILVLGAIVSKDISKQESYGKRAKGNILYGIYEVDVFVLNGDTVELSRKNRKVWDRLIIDKRDALVEKMNRDRFSMKMEIDSNTSKLVLKSYLDKKENYEFNFNLVQNDLILFGISDKDTLKIEFTRKDRTDFFLEKRGFKWINEYPMNR